jgi:hypothetical protein
VIPIAQRTAIGLFSAQDLSSFVQFSTGIRVISDAIQGYISLLFRLEIIKAFSAIFNEFLIFPAVLPG